MYHQKNSGQAGARNYALSIARGEYVGFVDSDDYIAPNMYETMVDSLERNDADIVVCGRLMVRGEVATVAQMFHMDKETVFENSEAIERFFTYKRVDSSPTDKLYKRDIISDIKFPLGYICEDIPFVYDAISRANKVVHCGHEFYYYRVREGSTSRSGFSVRGMGLYYNAKTVYEKSIVEYPELKQEIEFFWYKNLLVLAYRIALTNSKSREGEMVNSEIRRDIKKICSNKILKKKYKFFARTVSMRIQKLAVRIGNLLGIKVG